MCRRETGKTKCRAGERRPIKEIAMFSLKPRPDLVHGSPVVTALHWCMSRNSPFGWSEERPLKLGKFEVEILYDVCSSVHCSTSVEAED